MNLQAAELRRQLAQETERDPAEDATLRIEHQRVIAALETLEPEFARLSPCVMWKIVIMCKLPKLLKYRSARSNRVCFGGACIARRYAAATEQSRKLA